MARLYVLGFFSEVTPSLRKVLKRLAEVAVTFMLVVGEPVTHAVVPHPALEHKSRVRCGGGSMPSGFSAEWVPRQKVWA